MTDADTTIEPSHNIAARLLQTMVETLEACAVPFNQLDENAQQQIIDGLRDHIVGEVKSLQDQLYAGDNPACPAQLDVVSIKGSIMARLTIDKKSPARHQLLDAVGMRVVVVVADPEIYLHGIKNVRAQAKQRDMFREPNVPVIPHMDVPEPGTEDPPDPDDAEENWLDHNNGDHVEKNVINGKTRRSKDGLIADLIDVLTTWNADPKNDSVGFSEAALHSESRMAVLYALGWFTQWTSGKAETLEPPLFLQIPHPPSA